jgi:hypothetical protein
MYIPGSLRIGSPWFLVAAASRETGIFSGLYLSDPIKTRAADILFSKR